MQMTDSEICTSYRQALNRGKQIETLAQLNACPREHIIEILIAGNYTIEKPHRGKQGLTDWQIKQIVNLDKQGYWLSEIAEQLNMPRSTVCTKLNEWRRKNGHGNRIREDNTLSS